MVLMMIVDDMAAGGDAAAALKSQPSVGVPADVVEGQQAWDRRPTAPPERCSRLLLS
jgi:hypothetical protein